MLSVFFVILYSKFKILLSRKVECLQLKYVESVRLKPGTFWSGRHLLVSLMEKQQEQFSRKSAPQKTARLVETIYGCKWSLTVYQLLQTGINRPGEMVRSVEGLSTKVLNDCLRRNVEFGIFEKVSFSEIPPRVEYRVTTFGKKFLRVLDEIEKLQLEIEFLSATGNDDGRFD